MRLLAIAVVVLGLWRVGVEAPHSPASDSAALPQLVENIRFDLDYARGSDRAIGVPGAVLRRQSSTRSRPIEMIRYVAETTRPSDAVLVFGFVGRQHRRVESTGAARRVSSGAAR